MVISLGLAVRFHANLEAEYKNVLNKEEKECAHVKKSDIKGDYLATMIKVCGLTAPRILLTGLLIRYSDKVHY